MDELTFDVVRLPGVAEPSLTGPYQMVLRPTENRVLRASFHGDLPLTATSVLGFGLHAKGPAYFRADIIDGDVGFPSVHIENKAGSILRFSRGNMKDFLDISKPQELHEIRLPVGAFVYDNFLKSNVPIEEDFFSHGVSKIYFDFLGPAESEINMEISNFHIARAVAQPSHHVQDLVIFERVGQARKYPKFSTDSGQMSFGLSLSSAGLAAGLAEARLSISVELEGQVVDEHETKLTTETVYLGLKFPKIAAYSLRAVIHDGEGVVARSEWPVVRVVPHDVATQNTILGVSDEFQYDHIAASGGSWDRIVVPMTSVLQDESVGFRFAFGRDPLPSTTRNRP